MTPVVGVFSSRIAAAEGVERLVRAGINRKDINILTPASSDQEIASIPVSETEQPGMGAAVGRVIGGALGTAGGLGVGAAFASLFLPGVGPVMVGGLLGAGLLGLTGAAGGAAAGEAMEDTVSGLPRDELYVYEDALRKGRTVIIVRTDNGLDTSTANQALLDAGAESIDAARKEWWIGLRSAERETYDSGDFAKDEPLFRKGFEAAQSPAVRGKSYEGALEYLALRHEAATRHPAFRRGYERGRQYREQFSSDQT